MSEYYEPILQLFNTEAGSLTYFIILQFSIVGALLAALSRGHRHTGNTYRRTIVGLSVLLFLQVVLLTTALLTRFAVIPPELIQAYSFLPVIERTIALLNIILIIWLWSYPDLIPSADTSFLLLGLISILIMLASTGNWINQGAAANFNGTSVDLIASITALILLFAGIVITLIRRPVLWGFGFTMLFVLILGYLAHLVLLPQQGDYPLAVRLAQLAAFPLLLVLAQRIPRKERSLEKEIDEDEISGTLRYIQQQHAILDSRPSYTDPKVLQSLSDLFMDPNPRSVCQKITVTVARIMQADICLLIQPPNDDGEILIQCGYDSKRKMTLQNITLEGDMVPELSSTVLGGDVCVLPSDSTAPDLETLANRLGFDRSGSILALYVLSDDGKPISGIVLLSPYTGREWTQGDQYYLNVLAKLLVYFLQHSIEIAHLQDQLVVAQRTELETRQQLEHALTEEQVLMDQVSQFRESAERMEADEQGDDIARQWVPESQLEEMEQLKGELQLALNEIALLNAALDETNKKDIS
ncbi:hypothetical protein ACFLUA_00795 [Chloroflexota bacterium]